MSPRGNKSVKANNLSVTQEQVKNLLYKTVKITYHNRGREISDVGVITAAFGTSLHLNMNVRDRSLNLHLRTQMS